MRGEERRGGKGRNIEEGRRNIAKRRGRGLEARTRKMELRLRSLYFMFCTTTTVLAWGIWIFYGYRCWIVYVDHGRLWGISGRNLETDIMAVINLNLGACTGLGFVIWIWWYLDANCCESCDGDLDGCMGR